MKLTKEWAMATIIRAVKTAAEVALGMLTIGKGLTDFDWIQILSVAVVAGIYSILSCIVFGVPEAESDGVLMVDSNGEKQKWLFSVSDSVIDDITNKKSIRLTIDPNANLAGPEDENNITE